MLKRALVTFSELTLWLLLLAVLFSGCSQSEATSSAAGSSSSDSKGNSRSSPALSDRGSTSSPSSPGSVAFDTTKIAAGGSASEPASTASAAARVASAKLIPRDVLFGNPQKAAARISPDGKWLSFMVPVDGVLNVLVAPVADVSQAKVVTHEKVRPVPGYRWAFDSKHILYVQDVGGNENFHLYATNVETAETKDLTPIDGVRAEIQETSHKFPAEVLVGLNDRDRRYHDIWRINIDTGQRQLVQKNEGVNGYLTDDDFNVRMAIDFTPDAGQVWLVPEGEGDQRKWTKFAEFGPEDAMSSGPAGFDKSGQVLYYEDSRNRNTAGLFSMDLKTRQPNLIADDPRCDVGSVVAQPIEKTIQAVSFTYAREEWKILDPAVQADFDYLKKVQDGEFIITSRTLDDSQWTVAYIRDNGPVEFYRYLRQPERKAIHLFNSRDDLKDYPLVKMHDVVIKSRDGLNLVSYLSLPPGSDPDGDGKPNQPVPLVLDVHGGPWARDDWGFNSDHQWLANRGYAVLSVNYRGSTGFGKNFVNAADGEWSGKMHDDLIDAVHWAIDQKIAIGDKVAIMGGSYGGYATLVGLTYTPDVFACGVDIVGPSSLVTLLQNVPEYWYPFMPVMKRKVGDVDTEEGRAALLKRSPLTLVDKITRPLLIGQGAERPARQTARGRPDRGRDARETHPSDVRPLPR